jgi:hypothetical protein
MAQNSPQHHVNKKICYPENKLADKCRSYDVNSPIERTRSQCCISQNYWNVVAPQTVKEWSSLYLVSWPNCSTHKQIPRTESDRNNHELLQHSDSNLTANIQLMPKFSTLFVLVNIRYHRFSKKLIIPLWVWERTKELLNLIKDTNLEQKPGK